MTQIEMVSVPLVIRGRVIEDYALEHGGRHGELRFRTPDIAKYLKELVEPDPAALRDFHALPMAEIVTFLGELQARLDPQVNPYWRDALEVSCQTSNVSRPVLEEVFRNYRRVFAPDHVRDVIASRIGFEYLDGWAPRQLSDGRVLNVRAMGARGVHVIAGNVPACACVTLLRTAITRSDVIVKLPSNDLLTMVALARTMIDIDPNHPLTRHVSAAYWKGGDEQIERQLYRPEHVEKIVAWGGHASIKHIARYVQPGIELITLDPKNSMTLIGRAALADERTMRTVATRVAADIGGFDQEGCVCARVVFIESGTDEAGIEAANRFGAEIFDALGDLPQRTSAGPRHFDPMLKDEIDAILPLNSFYRVFSDPHGIERSGAVIVSQMSEQVDFTRQLYGRVANLVPVDDIEDALEHFTAATQAVGIYPDSLRRRLRDECGLRGAEMLVPVGYATTISLSGPMDGTEAERRMCRWIADTDHDGTGFPAPWMHDDEVAALVARAA